MGTVEDIFGASFGSQGVVALDEARANEEDVAGFDVSALGGGTEVEALRLGAGLQGGVADAVRGVGVVGDGVGVGVVFVV